MPKIAIFLTSIFTLMAAIKIAIALGSKKSTNENETAAEPDQKN